MSHLRRKFFTIMWKNITIRKRHWFNTLLELVVPIALFYLLVYIHNKANKTANMNTSQTLVYPPKSEKEILELPFVHNDVLILAYTPDTPFTSKIMSNVKNTFNEIVNQRPYYSGRTGGILNVTACATEKEVQQFFATIFKNSSENNYLGYGVIFNDDNTKFHYTLRSSASSWKTEQLFPPINRQTGAQTDHTMKPLSQLELIFHQYMFEGFVALQLAIDKAYIEVVTSTKSAYEIVLQQFPDPATNFGDLIISIYKVIIPLITMLSFILVLPQLLKRIVEEKQTGIKELMKMVGLKNWMIWTGWMMNTLMVYLITCIVITYLLTSDLNGFGAIFMYTHWSLVFVLFLMFCILTVAFSFVISAFFYKPNIAMTVGMLLWTLSYTFLNTFDNTGVFLKILMCLIPSLAVKHCVIVMLIFEKNRSYLTWMNLFSDGLGGHGMSVGLIFCSMILYTFLYVALAWYIDSLFPGPFGRAKPFYFIFKWLLPRSSHESISQQQDDENENFEPVPRGFKVGISIRNLRKTFGSHVVAVDGVNLDIYEGQITALLGHNGAGKTTTMSILTGMFSPSSGSVYVQDYNIFEKMDDFQSNLGLCPQHNLLFSYLDVIEHLVFFGMLKGLSFRTAEEEGMKLLNLLKIADKKSVMVAKLSGGMKRKLSLAIALIGNPQILMLDEPTSGMDPESRRELWDLLLKMRGQRTIIITTHFMEEADVLGDRIAIMDHGRVRCYGTTIFLKKLYGTGYLLTLMVEPSAKVSDITSVIQANVEGATLKTTYSSQVTYSLPQEASEYFPKLFAELESKKLDLRIKGVGIACTTMEEVFLKVGELSKDEHDKLSLPSREHTMRRNHSQEVLTFKKLKGLPLLMQQLICLVKKKILWTRRKWIGSLAFAMFALFMVLSTVRIDVVNIQTHDAEPSLELRLSAYAYLSPDTYIASSENKKLGSIFKKLVSAEGSDVKEISNTNIIPVLLNESTSNVEHYEKQMLIAAQFNSTTATGLFSATPLHATPIVLNLITQTILQSNPSTSSYTISIANHPLNVYATDKCASVPQELADGISFSSILITFVWLGILCQGLLFLVSDAITFPLAERVCNAKQIQIMTGVPHVVYWLSCFIWDYLLYIFTTIAMLVVILLGDAVGMFSQAVPLGVFALITLLFGISGITYAYLFSYTAKTPASATSLFLTVNCIIGLISFVAMYFLLILADAQENAPTKVTFISPWIIYLINNLLCLNPHYALIGASTKFASITLNNYLCDLCPDPAHPCTKRKYFSYNMKDGAMGLYVTYLALDWILYGTLILLIDFGYTSILWNKIKAKWTGDDYDRIDREDSDVKDERDRVDAARTTTLEDYELLTKCGIPSDGDKNEHTKESNYPKGQQQIVLTANGLVKKFSRSFAAVKGVSFQVAAGECFGLLGVNGAGKTTTFRMLTGDEIPTAGEATIFNFTLANNRSQYLKQIGYCPQFDGINTVLTGDEMLTLFALLRGVHPRSVQPQVDDWITLLGLEEYRYRQCGKYSGGNKRKLCTALALIGDPPLVFLDEPTSGVDPVSRRNLWDVLARSQKAGQAIVLTSHSMEECEALCSRLTIMVKGRMMCIGNNQYIKQRYGQGFTIMIKLFGHLNTDTVLPKLKKAIKNIFYNNCVLKDEHKGLLHYHITDSKIPLSQLFSSMENLKKNNSLIEDYTISDTTLEQVFIAFAKQSNEED